MKVIVRVTLISLLLLQLSSCVPETHPPIGVWKNENLNITLYVKPDYELHIRGFLTYMGTCIIGDDITKLFVEFAPVARLTIFKASFDMSGRATLGDWLISGNFRVIGDELLLNLNAASIEGFSYSLIVFHRLEEYYPINPQDWWVR